MTALDRGSAAAIPGAVDLNLFGGKVRLLGFGKYYPNPNGVLEKQDWSWRPFRKDASEEEMHLRRFSSTTLYGPKIAREHGIKIVDAPTPAKFNAEICTESESMSYRIHVESPLYHNSFWLDRGADADGTILRPGQHYGVTTAGCPVVAVHHPSSSGIGVIHAGGRSVINEEGLKGNPGARKSESVVYNLLDAMGYTTAEVCSSLHAVIAFPIDPKYFTYRWDDPDYSELNQKRSMYVAAHYGEACAPGYNDPVEYIFGRIDLEMLIRMQLIFRGVQNKNIQTILPPLRKFWYDTRESNEDRLKRNLVFITNY